MRNPDELSPEGQDVTQVIREWLAIAAGRKGLPADPLYRFVAVWVAFNAFLHLQFPAAGTDREQVKKFGRWEEARRTHLRALGESESGYRDALGVLQARGVLNLKRNTRVPLEDIENIEEVIDVVYQVRCNLFHGQKSPSNVRDRRLVSASYAIVTTLLEYLLDSEATASAHAV